MTETIYIYLIWWLGLDRTNFDASGPGLVGTCQWVIFNTATPTDAAPNFEHKFGSGRQTQTLASKIKIKIIVR